MTDARYTLLIVDDEPLILAGMRRALEALTLFALLTARSGAQALTVIDAQRVDAMLLDISMPDMNGIELMRALADRANKPVTVVVSGYDKFDYARQALSYGALDYVLKPLDTGDVQAIGRRVFSVLDERAEVEKLRRQAEAARADAAEAPVDKNRRAAEAAKLLIGEQFTDPALSVNGIARQLSYSPNYLGTVFRRAFGHSINDYLNRLRVEKARALIDGGNRLIYEVAFLSGYADQHYFSRTFKKYVGLTPSEYRDAHYKNH